MCDVHTAYTLGLIMHFMITVISTAYQCEHSIDSNVVDMYYQLIIKIETSEIAWILLSSFLLSLSLLVPAQEFVEEDEVL